MEPKQNGLDVGQEKMGFTGNQVKEREGWQVEKSGKVSALVPGIRLENIHSSIVCERKMWETVTINRSEQVNCGVFN